MAIPEIENRHKNHHVSFWINEEKSKASEEGETTRPIIQNKSASKALEKGNNCVIGSEATKKPCLCSPTNHAGSFRCRLHRKNKSPQKRDSISYNNNNNNNNGQQQEQEVKDKSIKVNGFNMNNQPRLSRFGKAACDQLPLPIASSRPGQVN